jgi:hypothetical protein
MPYIVAVVNVFNAFQSVTFVVWDLSSSRWWRSTLRSVSYDFWYSGKQMHVAFQHLGCDVLYSGKQVYVANILSYDFCYSGKQMHVAF